MESGHDYGILNDVRFQINSATFDIFTDNTVRLRVGNALVAIPSPVGLVIGNSVQITAADQSELQILGTSGEDSSAIIARFSADSLAPNLDFVKSRNAAVGSNTIVVDNDVVGQLRFFPADGADFATQAAIFSAEVDDASPAAGDIGMAFVWQQMPGGGGGIAETMRLTSAGLALGATGTAIQDSFAASAVIDFGSISDTTADSSAITVTGAALGDVCSVGHDLAATEVSGSSFTCYVSATNAVTVRHSCNGTCNPGSDTFRVRTFDP